MNKLGAMAPSFGLGVEAPFVDPGFLSGFVAGGLSVVALVGVPAFAWSKGSGLRGRAAGFFARLAGCAARLRSKTK